MTDAQALSNAQARALLAPFLRKGEPVALAVSGGPDSMALAWCALAAKADAQAFIVDHGLRAESAKEAHAVRKQLLEMGMKAKILRWKHEAVTSRVHVEARKARYDLLFEACRRGGIKTLLLAHHRDDQAETILLRLAKGSGVTGLAGMARRREVGGICLARPFLDIPKARLVATCKKAKILFVTDPSNEKEKYARGRLRRILPLLASEGLSVERLIDLGARAFEASQAIAFYAGKLLQDAGSFEAGGTLRLDLSLWRQAPRAVAFKALELGLAAIHAAPPYPPERKALLRLAALLLDEKRPLAAHLLAGVRIQKSGGGTSALFFRDFRAIESPVFLKGGQKLLWDGRYEIRLPRGAKEIEIRPLGLQTKVALDALDPTLRKRIPQGLVRAALPSFWQNGSLKSLAVPL